MKDGLVPLGAVLYVLGFFVWAIFSEEYGLGSVSVLDAQYVVAGIVPFAIGITGAAIVLIPIRALDHWIKGNPSQYELRLSMWLTGAGSVAALGGLLVGKITGATLQGVAVLLGLLLMVIGLALRRSKAGSDGVKWQRFALGFSKVAVGFAALLAILLFSARVFPHVPPELGGPEPHCVMLDLESGRLSRETRTLLAEVAATSDPIVRTRALYLIRTSDDFLLLSSQAEIEHGLKVYRIDRKSVAAILPCEP